MTSYNRRDVLRIMQISIHQLQGWERAGLIPHQQTYTFQDLGQLRTLQALRAEAVPAASIRDSIMAMKAVAGMANPLLEARLVRTGSRLAFRHEGAMVDPIRRQLLFDFDRAAGGELPTMARAQACSGNADTAKPGGAEEKFFAAVQAEESGDKVRAIALYEEVLALDPHYAAAYINLGTMQFHLHQFERAEQLYRQATEVDPGYVLAYFDLGNVLDELARLEESIAAYLKAVALAPRYADAHYNLALAYERCGRPRTAMKHWQAYLKIDQTGPWAEHAHGQIRKLLAGEGLAIAWRAERFVAPSRERAALVLV